MHSKNIKLTGRTGISTRLVFVLSGAALSRLDIKFDPQARTRHDHGHHHTAYLPSLSFNESSCKHCLPARLGPIEPPLQRTTHIQARRGRQKQGPYATLALRAYPFIHGHSQGTGLAAFIPSIIVPYGAASGV